MPDFPPYSLDTSSQYLKRGSECIALTPKSFAVLRYLVENAGRLVTKDELLDSIWPDTHIHEAVLKSCILEIRRALQDDANKPKYILTRHRLGYQFIAPVVCPTEGKTAPLPLTAGLLGRSRELIDLQGRLEATLRGSRQIVFIAGEPGIGKTALVDHFLDLDSTNRATRVARGECLEHFGDREPYYAMLDALSRAARSWTEGDLVGALKRYAPTWLLQMPALIPDEEFEKIRQICLGVSRERMLREMSEALEVLASVRPLILVLEDLHWADAATVDLIASIANRRSPAPLLLIGTYRPVELIVAEHPLKTLKQELHGHGRCVELQLDVLGRADTGEFLARRFPLNDFPQEFGDLIYRVTDGHPLFLLNAIDYAVSRNLVTETGGCWTLRRQVSQLQVGVPENVMQMIDRQMDRLSAEEKAILESASVCGVESRPDWIASVMGADPIDVEEKCESLVRRKLFLKAADETAIESTVSRYVFIHSLYREAFFRLVAPRRRRQLHDSFGSCLERDFAGREREVSAELAYHFQNGSDPLRAVRYLSMASQRAVRRHSPGEAFALLEQALALVPHLPIAQRDEIELRLLEELGQLYRLTGQLRESANTFERMVQKAIQCGELRAQITAQQSLAGVLSWFDRERCLAWVDRTKALPAESLDTPDKAIMRGHVAYWNLLFRGWSDDDAAASAAALEACRQRDAPSSLALTAARHSYFLCLSANYREAIGAAEQSLRKAIEIDSFMDYSVAHYFQIWALLHLGEWGKAQNVLEEATTLAQRNGHLTWTLLFRLLEMWLHVQTFSYRTALEIGGACLEQARSLPHPLSEQISLILLGTAHAGIGENKKAEQRFSEVIARHSRERILMDWIWKMPLQCGMFELRTRQGDWESAACVADEFFRITSATAEVTWHALACCARATAALQRKKIELARRAIHDGELAIAGREAPLAEWRLEMLAFHLEASPQRRRRAVEVIHGLADSLDKNDPLRKSFLSAPSVEEALRTGVSRKASTVS
jgi:DNA-binding winged helix-turn-helix (wHTH) protein/tetratricopeptide (TPR) repeat protein